MAPQSPWLGLDINKSVPKVRGDKKCKKTLIKYINEMFIYVLSNFLYDAVKRS